MKIQISKLRELIREVYEEILESESSKKRKIDQNKDKKYDFDDVRIARYIASGLSREEALEKIKKNKK